jgi:hypothetical protein
MDLRSLFVLLYRQGAMEVVSVEEARMIAKIEINPETQTWSAVSHSSILKNQVRTWKVGEAQPCCKGISDPIVVGVFNPDSCTQINDMVRIAMEWQQKSAPYRTGIRTYA